MTATLPGQIDLLTEEVYRAPEVLERLRRDRTCTWCGLDCRSRRGRREHSCPAKALHLRTEALCWPLAPVQDYLVRKLGWFHKQNNPDGFSAAAVERLTRGAISETTWKTRREGDGMLSDRQADAIATALARPPTDFWPDFYTALDYTEADMDWLADWSAGRT